MSIEISGDQRHAIQQSGIPCLQVHDPSSSKVYLLIEEGELPEIEPNHLEYIREGINAAMNQVAEGRVQPWDITTAISRATGKAES